VTAFGRQRDGISCGPAVAVVAGALLEPSSAGDLVGERFASEQGRVHLLVNMVWPRRLGMTPAGLARALSVHRPYRWRRFRGRRDALDDVLAAVTAGRPVGMLVGNGIPRHWVLLISVGPSGFSVYEPSSGELRPCALADIRTSRLVGLGFPRPWAFVLPRP